MKINIKATGTTLTPSITAYIEKKINMLDKFFSDSSALVSVEVGKISKHHKSGDIFRAEIKINEGRQNFYAVSEMEDLYAAIDVVKDDITRELTSKRKKSLHLFRRGGAKVKNIMKGIADAGDKSWKKFRNKK